MKYISNEQSNPAESPAKLIQKVLVKRLKLRYMGMRLCLNIFQD